jgi:hypothetical protein
MVVKWLSISFLLSPCRLSFVAPMVQFRKMRASSSSHDARQYLVACAEAVGCCLGLVQLARAGPQALVVPSFSAAGV